jgi:hypothetical protein
MRSKTLTVFLALAMSAALMFAPAADAIVSSVANVQLSYVVGESITITGAPPTLTFSGAPVPATGPLTVTTTWVLASTRTRVDLAIFFQTPSAALTDGSGNNIPTSQVFANINGGSFSPCNFSGVAPELTAASVAGGMCAANTSVQITSANVTGSRSDTVVLQLQGLSAALPAGTYTGQVSLIAGAN